jgi:hypothetical protein
MRNFLKLAGVIALAAAITFSAALLVTACDDGSTEAPRTVKYVSNANGNTYTLTITEKTSRAAYTAQKGDRYVLKIEYANGTTKTSKGTVSAVEADGSLKLLPSGASAPFTVTMNSSGEIASITGTITFEAGEPEQGPGGVTPDTGGSAFLGTKLVFSGEQVYTYKETNNTVTYPEYKGNLTLEDNNGGTVTITGGKFSYTIGTPVSLEDIGLLFGYYDEEEDSFDDGGATVSNKDAKYFQLYEFVKYDDNTGTSYYLSKENNSINRGDTSYTQTYEMVRYLYVDRDVTVSRKGETINNSGSNDDGTAYTSTMKSNDISLALKTGWNVLHYKMVLSYTYPSGGNIDNYTNATLTQTISLNNPSFKWVLGESKDEDEWDDE